MNDEEEAGTSKDSPQPIEDGPGLPSYDAPPPRPKGSNIADYAWNELNRAGLFTGDGDLYGGMTGRAVMDLVDVFVEQGHSGMSGSLVADAFHRLVMFEPLGPLTDDPDEWDEVADGLWRSRRQSRAFSPDGGKTYLLNGDRDTLYRSAFRIDRRGFVKECEHCSGDGFEPMTGKWRESHACRVCGGDGEVAPSIEGTS